MGSGHQIDRENLLHRKVTEVHCDSGQRTPIQARLVEAGGAALLELNGTLEPFVAFKPTEHADEALFDTTVARTVRDMAQRGVHVHFVPVYFGWEGPGEYVFRSMDQRIGQVIEADPQARLVIRIQAASMCPQWWMAQHPDELLQFGFSAEQTGPRPPHQTGPMPSLASDFWTTHALDALTALAEHVQQQDYRRHVVGYLPTALNSNEWFIRSYDDLQVADFAPVMQRRFARYIADNFDLPDVKVPDRTQRSRGDLGFLLHPDPRHSHAPVSAFYRFINERCASLALEHVRTLRRAHRQDQLVVGLFYGYNLGLANFCWLADSGHLDLRTLLDAEGGPDFVSSPLEYFTRNTREKPFGGFCWAQGPAPDSARLAGKAYFAEDDFCPPLPDQPAGWSNAGDEREDVELMRRNFAFTLCKGNLLWWYDLNGHWFESTGRLGTIQQCARIARRAIKRDRRNVSQVAVFMDERAPQMVTLDRQMQRGLFWSSFFESFADIGAPVDLFMLSDLDRVDLGGYRTVCFPTAFALDRRQRSIIEQLKTDDRTLVFSSASGLIDPDNGLISDDLMSQTVGIDIAARNVLHPLRLSTGCGHRLLKGFEDESFGVFTEVSPVFYVEDPQAIPLGYFATRGPVGMAVREHETWTSVYCAVPGLASALMRNIIRESGVHLYRDGDEDIVYANAGYVSVFSREAGRRHICLPSTRRVYDCFADRWLSEAAVDGFDVDFEARKTYLYELH